MAGMEHEPPAYPEHFEHFEHFDHPIHQAHQAPPGSPSHPPRYQQMAEQVVQAIAQGALRPGQRLPSVREWARQHGVSHNTALQAMRWLEDERWVQARARSGFFVAQRAAGPDLHMLAGLEPRAVNVEWCLQRLLGRDVPEGAVSFGSVTPDLNLLAPERVRHAMQRAVTEHGNQLCRYPDVYSLPELQQALARYAMSLGCVLPPDDIIVTHGCMDAVVTALRAVAQPGDVVAVESPAHFSFFEALQHLGLRGLEIPTDPHTGISLDALQLALDHHPVKAVLVVPTLQNPLSCSMPQTHRQRLAAMAAQHDVAVIEDAIYNDWATLEAQRKAVKAYDKTGHVILCHAFTKSLAPGLRLGWLHAGRWTMRVKALREAQLAMPTAVLQLALANLIGQGGHAAHMRRCRQLAAARLREARGLVLKHFPPGVKLNPSAQGLMFWFQLPAAVQAELFHQRCLQEGILVPPGRYFSPSKRHSDCARIAVGHWSDAHRKGLIRMGQIAWECAAPQRLSA